MQIKKIAALACGLALAGALAAGCSGGGANAKFCELLGDDTGLADFSVTNPDSMATALEKMKELQAAAPESLKADLTTMIEAVDVLANTDMTDTDALTALAEKVDPQKMEEATKRLDEETSKLCK